LCHSYGARIVFYAPRPTRSMMSLKKLATRNSKLETHLPPGVRALDLFHYDGDEAQAVAGAVPREVPLRIQVNSVDLVTLSHTPARSNTLVLGFLYLEGLIDGLDDVALLRVCDDETVAEVRLAREVDVAALAEQRRTITSGCGGGTTFGLIDPARLPPVSSTRTVTAAQLQDLMGELLMAAQAYLAAGGLHTSALSDGDRLLVLAEDVGRHNTLDKVMGECLLRGLSPADGILLTTGRVSSEMLLKAVRMDVPIVVSRTSPTDLSVALARDLNVTLVGYVRGPTLNVYAGAERFQG